MPMRFQKAYFQIPMNSTIGLKVIIEGNGQVINFTAADSSISRMVRIIKGALEEGRQQYKEGISLITVVFMKEIFKIMKHTAKEHIMIPFKTTNILVDGKGISHMVEEEKNLEMDHTIKGSFVMELSKETDIMFVNQVFIKENLL